ncbi:MAG: hypothetical protein ABSE63_00715 [Thermoguttaceae bacterium]|jgi:hypothetical protein
MFAANPQGNLFASYEILEVVYQISTSLGESIAVFRALQYIHYAGSRVSLPLCQSEFFLSPPSSRIVNRGKPRQAIFPGILGKTN